MNMQPNKYYGSNNEDGAIDALYARLSQEDKSEGDSNSIKNQKAILAKYAKEHGLTNPKFYVDDGYSGTNFNRPGFQSMMEDLEAGRLRTIVVKDMSRLGRDYLRVGYYTEITFPEAGVRFVAINDNVDSDVVVDNDFTPFRNIMNEWYAKDTSKKIRAVWRAKGMSGKHLCTNPPYGYLKDKDDNQKWIVDEEAAEVVRWIFGLCMKGFGPTQIARMLNEREIDTPVIHAKKQGRKLPVRKNEFSYIWDTQSVIKILSRYEYLGHTANFKTCKKSYKNKKKIDNDFSDWVIFKNTHEAIIDEVTYETVQKIRQGKRHVNRMGEPSVFSGMLYCADCGKRMYLCRTVKAQQKEYFNCSTYRKKKKNLCTSHQITVEVVEKLVLEQLRNIVAYAKDHEQEFLHSIQMRSQKELAKVKAESQAELSKASSRIDEIDRIIQRLYEDNIGGKITDERFQRLTETYEAEQANLRERVGVLKEEVKNCRDESDMVAQFMRCVKKHTEITELTADIVREFIDKIYVYQAEVVDGRRKQSIKIVLNFIGEIDFTTLKKEAA